MLAIIFWDILMFGKISVSPQVWIVIISNKHGIHEFPHDLPDDFRLTTSVNWEISRRSQNIKTCSLVLNLAPKFKIFSRLAKQLLKKRNWTFLVGCYFTEKLQFVWDILARIVFANSIFLVTYHQAPSNLISLTILLTLRGLIQF